MNPNVVNVFCFVLFRLSTLDFDLLRDVSERALSGTKNYGGLVYWKKCLGTIHHRPTQTKKSESHKYDPSHGSDDGLELETIPYYSTREGIGVARIGQED